MTAVTIGEMDRVYFDSGIKYLCGVDEAGRGPLAGPVVAAAVILPEDSGIDGIMDSKKLTAKSRERLYPVIIEKAVAYSIAEASVEEIDACNILNATLIAMRRAVEGLSKMPELVLVDGNTLPELEKPATAVVKGDTLSLCIAAASILAKVHRDRIMEELDRTYPQYHLSIHKGYPTKKHYEALDAHGPCDIHRKTFLRKWAANNEQR